MKEVELLIKKALKYKESGLTEHEISEELNVSKETAVWLLSKGKEKKPTGDLKIGWRSIGVYPSRISFISDALCDIILEECEEVDTIVGIAINGVPFSSFVADKLGLEMVSSNYASVQEKNVVFIDDVVGSGETFKAAIKAAKAEKAKPVLCVAVLNKTSVDKIADVPLRSLIRARVL